MSHPTSLSIILPCLNEAASLKLLIPVLKQHQPTAEILIVDDGSTDDSATVAKQLGATVISHPYRKGNGAAIKSGARAATGEILVFMDADNQHNPADIARLVNKLEEGYDMVVGARDAGSQASLGRSLANGFYNRLASWIVEHPVADLTSGFRAVRAKQFREFLYLLPNTFSYPTTITMAFFRAGYNIQYIPIVAAKRIGKSHIRPLKDGVRFLMIIFKIGTLYSPLKIFVPFSALFFLLGLHYYIYTFLTSYRFTNMGLLLFLSSVLIFLIGLISEQITQLMYRKSE